MQSPGRFRIDPPGADPLVRDTLVAAGWEAAGEGSDDWNLLWSVGEPGAPTYARLRDDQFVNHVPGIAALARKDRLPRTLERGLCLLADLPPPFHPETYLLPEELGAFRARAAADPGATWIQKPRAGARGEGISLVEDVDAVETGSNWLVQRYLARPHLLDGRKYTLRRYVLVTALDPLTAWVFGDGFAKLASRPYSLRADELGDRFRHLTNPDVQAENPEVAISADNLTFGAYAERLQAAGDDAAALFARVDRVVAAAIGSARDELARSTWRATNNPGGCFELLGLDILVDEDMRPWLLECNLNPSLSVEADDDPDGETRASREERELKSALVRDLCRVVGLLDVAPGEPSFRRLLPDERLAALLPLPRPGEGGVPRELRPAEGVTAEPVGGALVLYEPATSRAHVLDSVASYLWVAWAEGLSVDEIAAELTEALPEAAWRAEVDVRNALAEWFELGLAVDGRRARVEPPPAAAPRLRWNRERIYRCLDTVLAVTSPNDELEGWLDVSLGPLADEPAEQVDAYVEIVPSRTGWEVVAAGERQPVRSPRQLGPVVRSLLLRRAAGPGAFAATLLADDDDHGLVLVGPAPLRAALTRGWLRDGGRCAGDNLVCLQPAASARGHAIGFEEPAGPTWWGDLPALADERPLLVATGGTFAQMWWPLAGGDGSGATIARPVFLRVDQPALPEALLAAAPLLPEDAFRDLIAARFADGPLSFETVQHAAQLVQAVPCFSVLVPDPSVGRGLLSALPALW